MVLIVAACLSKDAAAVAFGCRTQIVVGRTRNTVTSKELVPSPNENVIESEDNDDYTENLEKDMTNNKRRERKMSSKSNNSFKTLKKVGGAQRLSHQIDRLCEAVEPRSSNNDTCGASIKTAMEHLEAIPDLDPMSEIYMFATRLFLNKDKREIFVSITQSRVKLAWLISEKNEQDMTNNLIMSRCL
ncbi:hypothetical protein PIB30_059487 [Stylosanthes scabra]|uniref:Uncharacterized protein n=1 Tax=Stylosanthes scabra TaxID=79078 RepID=A0ABU6SK86_9FABA|nr:hypothetical protein [Stylosanthes scabra]